MISLTYPALAWLVLLSGLVGGSLAVYGAAFLAWSDRRREGS